MYKNCKYCGGKFRLTTKEYTLRSRCEKKSETVIENLSMYECTICGHKEMPESSEAYISMIRNIIQKEMEKQADKSSTQYVENIYISTFKKMLSKLIG